MSVDLLASVLKAFYIRLTILKASSSSGSANDTLETLLGQLDSENAESGEDSEELQNILENMMRQLMSKEILYEPLKELHEKVRVLHLLLSF